MKTAAILILLLACAACSGPQKGEVKAVPVNPGEMNYLVVDKATGYIVERCDSQVPRHCEAIPAPAPVKREPCIYAEEWRCSPMFAGVIWDKNGAEYRATEPGSGTVKREPKRKPVIVSNGECVSGCGTVTSDWSPGEAQQIERLEKTAAAVPPKEWDTTVPYVEPPNISLMPYFQETHPDTVTTHHIECEDKTRFLLTSEDGVKHCVRLPN